MRMPVLVVAKAKSVGMNFLTHNLLQFFSVKPEVSLHRGFFSDCFFSDYLCLLLRSSLCRFLFDLCLSPFRRLCLRLCTSLRLWRRPFSTGRCRCSAALTALAFC